MKYLLSILILTTQFVASQEVLSSNKAGFIVLGMKLSELSNVNKNVVIFKTNIYLGDEFPQECFGLTVDKKLYCHFEDYDVRLQTNTGKVLRIFIKSSNFLTERGAGVGVAFKEVKKAYPNGKLQMVEWYGLKINYVVPELNFYFNFNAGKLEGKSVSNISANDLSDKTVKQIFIPY